MKAIEAMVTRKRMKAASYLKPARICGALMTFTFYALRGNRAVAAMAMCNHLTLHLFPRARDKIPFIPHLKRREYTLCFVFMCFSTDGILPDVDIDGMLPCIILPIQSVLATHIFERHVFEAFLLNVLALCYGRGQSLFIGSICMTVLSTYAFFFKVIWMKYSLAVPRGAARPSVWSPTMVVTYCLCTPLLITSALEVEMMQALHMTLPADDAYDQWCSLATLCLLAALLCAWPPSVLCHWVSSTEHQLVSCWRDGMAKTCRIAIIGLCICSISHRLLSGYPWVSVTLPVGWLCGITLSWASHSSVMQAHRTMIATSCLAAALVHYLRSFEVELYEESFCLALPMMGAILHSVAQRHLTETLVLLAAVLSAASSNQIRINCMISVLLSYVLVQIKLALVFVLQVYFSAVETESLKAETVLRELFNNGPAVTRTFQPESAALWRGQPAQPRSRDRRRYEGTFTHLNDYPHDAESSQRMPRFNASAANVSKNESRPNSSVQRHKRKRSQSEEMKDSPKSKKMHKRVSFSMMVEMIDDEGYF